MRRDKIDVQGQSALLRAQSLIIYTMEQAMISRSDLARRLGVSRAVITDRLRKGESMTVRTLARTLAACGMAVEFSAVPLSRKGG